MFKQELNQKAKEILDKYGYEIDIEVMKGYDRRDFDPDHVKYNLSKEGKSVFKSECKLKDPYERNYQQKRYIHKSSQTGCCTMEKIF